MFSGDWVFVPVFLPLTKFVFDKEKGIELRWYSGPF